MILEVITNVGKKPKVDDFRDSDECTCLSRLGAITYFFEME